MDDEVYIYRLGQRIYKTMDFLGNTLNNHHIGSVTVTENLVVSGDQTIAEDLVVDGAFVIAGGISIGGDLDVTGVLTTDVIKEVTPNTLAIKNSVGTNVLSIFATNNVLIPVLDVTGACSANSFDTNVIRESTASTLAIKNSAGFDVLSVVGSDIQLLDALKTDVIQEITLDSFELKNSVGTNVLTIDGADVEITNSLNTDIVTEITPGTFELKNSTGANVMTINGANAVITNSLNTNLITEKTASTFELKNSVGTKVLSTSGANIHVAGALGIGTATPATQYTLSSLDGTAGQILTTDGVGSVTFETVSGVASVNQCDVLFDQNGLVGTGDNWTGYYNTALDSQNYWQNGGTGYFDTFNYAGGGATVPNTVLNWYTTTTTAVFFGGQIGGGGAQPTVYPVMIKQGQAGAPKFPKPYLYADVVIPDKPYDKMKIELQNVWQWGSGGAYGVRVYACGVPGQGTYIAGSVNGLPNDDVQDYWETDCANKAQDPPYVLHKAVSADVKDANFLYSLDINIPPTVYEEYRGNSIRLVVMYAYSGDLQDSGGYTQPEADSRGICLTKFKVVGYFCSAVSPASLVPVASIDHALVTNLSADAHPQYPLLIGRGAGQNLYGGADVSADLNLHSTTNATKGLIILNDPVSHLGDVDFNTNALLDVKNLQMTGSTSGTLTLQATAVTTSHTLTFPAVQGGASTVLTNDGTGALTWTAGGDASKLPLAGGTMAGTINMNVNNITNLNSLGFPLNGGTGETPALTGTDGVVISASKLRPLSGSTTSLGNNTYQFTDAYLSGNLYTDDIKEVSGSGLGVTIDSVVLKDGGIDTTSGVGIGRVFGDGGVAVSNGMLQIKGVDATFETGPNIVYSVAGNDYPMRYTFNYNHANMGELYGAYYDRASSQIFSSNVASNFIVRMASDTYNICYWSGGVVGNNINGIVGQCALQIPGATGVVDMPVGVKTDIINESTVGAGVTVEGVLIKDTKVEFTKVVGARKVNVYPDVDNDFQYFGLGYSTNCLDIQTANASGLVCFNHATSDTTRATDLVVGATSITAYRNILPSTTATFDLGSSGSKFNNIWGVALETNAVINSNATMDLKVNSGTVLTLSTTVATASIDLDMNAKDVKNVNTTVYKGTTSGLVTVKAQAVAGTYTMSLPNAQGVANSSLLNDGAGVLSWSTPPTIGMLRDGVQAIPTGVFTAINWNVNSWQNGITHSTSTNPEQITIVRPGKYSFCAEVRFEASTDTDSIRSIMFTINSATGANTEQRWGYLLTPAYANIGASLSTSTIMNLALNDVVRCFALHDSTVAGSDDINISGANSGATVFAVSSCQGMWLGV